jgi:Subtilase family
VNREGTRTARAGGPAQVPPAGGRRRRTGALALALACALACAVPAVAGANDAVDGANGDALQQAAPPPAPAAMCLVDTGVDLDPGTTPIVIGRDTVVGGSVGDEAGVVNPPVDGHPQDHGTFTALLAAAPDNGWGAPGLAPAAVRIWSVKVAPPDSLSIDPSAIVTAVERCVSLARSGVPIRTISISLAAKPPVYAGFSGALADAKAANLNVVVAAGNNPGVLGWPADVPGVIAVGADDAGDGSTCSFSPASALVTVLAPGCDSQFGGMQVPAPDDGTPMLLTGTSLATPLVAAALTALRAYAPEVSAAQAASCLTRAGGKLDVTAVFNACGVSIPLPGAPGDPRIDILGSSDAGTSDPPPAPRRRATRHRTHRVAHRVAHRASGGPGRHPLHFRPHAPKTGSPPVIVLP